MVIRPSGTFSHMAAEVRYPADMNGVNVPVSASNQLPAGSVVMHGMHSTADPSHLGYNYLPIILPQISGSFIAVSIDHDAINAIGGNAGYQRTCYSGTSFHCRVKILHRFVQWHIDMNNIGIMGIHGGDGVVQKKYITRV